MVECLKVIFAKKRKDHFNIFKIKICSINLTLSLKNADDDMTIKNLVWRLNKNPWQILSQLGFTPWRYKRKVSSEKISSYRHRENQYEKTTPKLQKFEGFVSSLTRGGTNTTLHNSPKISHFCGEYEIVHYAWLGKGTDVWFLSRLKRRCRGHSGRQSRPHCKAICGRWQVA